VATYFVISFGTRLLASDFTCGDTVVHVIEQDRADLPDCGSLAPSYLLSLVDDNQMHFMNAAYPLSGILGAIGLGHLILGTTIQRHRRIWQGLAIGMLALSTWNSAYSFWAVYRIGRVPEAIVSSAVVLANSDAYAASRWIEAHTPTDSVLAVSIHAEEDPQFGRRCDYSAFAERRVLLEGYHYLRGRDPNELAVRRKLLTDVFRHGDVAALRVLNERFLVTHLVLDNSDGQPAVLPHAFLAPLFHNGSVTVFAIRGPVSAS